MRLLACNASPRAGKSNTDLLLDAFLGAFAAAGGEVVARLHLARPSHAAEAARRFPEADVVLLAAPLYVNALPATGLAFVETLAPYVGRSGNPALLFLVQSGFPEALHSRPLERWLAKLASRLGAPYLGTIVKGGVEGIRSKPAWMRRRLLGALADLGRDLATTGRLDPAKLARLARPERLPLGPLSAVPLAIARMASEASWNSQLRRNGALAERDARPYEKGLSRRAT